MNQIFIKTNDSAMCFVGDIQFGLRKESGSKMDINYITPGIRQENNSQGYWFGGLFNFIKLLVSSRAA
jgi:hypothetical protein